MSQTHIRVAVLGVGRWGVHLVRNLLTQPEVRLVAIADPHPTQLNAIAEQFTLEPDTLLTPNWQQVLALPHLDAVAIATPATTHYPLIKAFLQRQCHILAEKPLTLEVESARELCDLANQQHRQLMVDHTYLFHPAVRRGRLAVEAGDLGLLRYGYASRTHLGPIRQDVDALWDLAIHDIAIFNYWLDAKPIQVQAQGSIWLQAHPTQAHPTQATLFPKGLADVVWVNLMYPNGLQITIHLCWLNPDRQRRSALVGSQGTLVFDELAAIAPLTLYQGQLQRQEERFVPINQHPCPLEVEPAEPLQQVCHHFLDCVRTNQPSPISSGQVAVQFIHILSALTTSLQQGGIPVPVDYLGLTQVH